MNAEPECDFPCLNSIDLPLSALWGEEYPEEAPALGAGAAAADTLIGGIRIVCPQDPDGCQLTYVFSDVQLALQRELLLRREGSQ